MATKYTNIYSNFPTAVMDETTVYNVTSDILPYINQFKAACESGDYASAQKIYNENNLEKYAISSYMWNKIFEEVRNIQIYVSQKSSSIHYVNSVDDLPANPIAGHSYRVKV